MARSAHEDDRLATAGDAAHQTMPVAQRLGQALLLTIHHLENLGVVVGPAHANLGIENSTYLVHLRGAQSWRVWAPLGYQGTEPRQKLF